MSIFKEIPPTAGLPIYLKDILSVFNKDNSRDYLEDDLRNFLNINYAKVTCSGTAAFYLVLESLKELSTKKTVVIPAFVCPLLPLAIKRAGLKVEICDINRHDFNFNQVELGKVCSGNNDILAIVPVHLGGLPLDFQTIDKFAQKNNIYIIEDCAQALGASYKGRKIGTLGDFSFFSLCRGKGLTIYEGGLVATNKREYAHIIDKKIHSLVKDDFFMEGLRILELFGYWFFYRPQLFWFVYRLPQIFWNLRGNNFRAMAEYFTTDFPIHKVSKKRKSIGHVSFSRIEDEIAKQREKAIFYLGGLKEIKGIKAITQQVDTRATYPYLTLIFDDPETRRKTLKAFDNLGFGVSVIYACAITDYDYLKDIIPNRDCPNARYMAEREITLSTSTFLNNNDMGSILNTIKRLQK